MQYKRIILENKDFGLFVIFNYVDKFLVFLLPLVVLYITKSMDTYNKIEYIYSIANVILPFFGFIASYAFYGYKISREKGEEGFIIRYRAFQSLMITILFFLGIIVSGFVPHFFSSISFSISFLIIIRFVFLQTVSNNNVYYRLIDKPVLFLLYSIICSIFSGILVFFFGTNEHYTLLCFFIPQLVMVLLYGFEIVQKKGMIKWRALSHFFVASINFAWPTVMNSTIVAFIMNYGKIYAYNCLSSYEMYNFSYLMRISMIIQMAHASMISYYGKDLYTKGYSSSFYKKYLFVITTAFLFTVCFVFFFNSYANVEKLTIDTTAFLIFIYTFIHCCGASLELFFSRVNMNRSVLGMSIISCIVFFILIFVFGVNDLQILVIYMVVYSLLYLVLLIMMAKAKKLLVGGEINSSV